ncbi:chemotaxis protein CheW [Paraburkholderia unamae]|uniref:CheW protein n=1 Tax=Paraburkholderia unamae TaxID=219649 RepID=A0ABX5KGX6_9BURK|nr:chemotaxis protein CheW [Paraburkholderia unamae]PVX78784.1 CheW protein [Paraburkholderia unamae]
MSLRSLAAGPNIELYGSFHLAGAELALPVAALQEVVNHPEALTPVPLAPPYLLGLFNLRGTLIPVVDLRQLLNLHAQSTSATRKVAIVETGGVRVGLQFDATGEILRVPRDQVIALATPEGGTPAAIGAVLKLDGGERILQVLAPAVLLGLRDVPHLAQTAPRVSERRAHQGQRRQNVSFKVGGTALALPMDAIQEIIRVPPLQHSPLADEVCIGMLNLRGATIPVLDFGAFLGFARERAEDARADERRIVVLHRNDLHFGLLVDEVASIVAYHDEELLAMPTYGGNAQRALFAGYLAAEGRAGVLLMNATALFDNERIVALAVGHRDLYRNALAQAEQKRGAGARQTLVTFRIGQLIGVRIAQLREVIDYRDDIVSTPGLPEFVRGVLNLRSVLVTVIDVRGMYGMPPYEDLSRAKVLIVEYEREKYGLLVDAVEDIVTLNGAAQLDMPSAFTRGENTRVHNDMHEAVELPGKGTLMLLDPACLCARVAQAAAAV